MLSARQVTPMQKRMRAGKNKAWVGYVGTPMVLKWVEHDLYKELGVDGQRHKKLHAIVKSVLESKAETKAFSAKHIN